MGRTYRRLHEGDYLCNDAEVRRLLADADPVAADHRILRGFSLDDLDRPSLTQYRQRFRAAKGDHSWLALEDRELLDRLGGWRRDRTSGEEGLTLAGLLMFGRDQAIRDPEAAPAFFVDYREKLDAGTRWNDRIYPDGTWEANLFQFFSRVWPRLGVALPMPFQLEDGVRRDETPAHEALREALVNALIHADHTAPGGVVIERHADRFLIENPGTLLVSVEQCMRGGVSECRNKALQQMFLMMGGGERAGSGADKIRSAWRAHQWRAPLITVRNQPDRIELVLPMVSLIPPGTLVHLRDQFGSLVDKLSPPEVQALATAEIEGSVSNMRLQELLADHPVDIGKMLQRLCERDLLVSDNRRRWTTYRLAGRPPVLPLFEPRGNSTQSEGGTPLNPGGDSTQSRGGLHSIRGGLHSIRGGLHSIRRRADRNRGFRCASSESPTRRSAERYRNALQWPLPNLRRPFQAAEPQPEKPSGPTPSAHGRGRAFEDPLSRRHEPSRPSVYDGGFVFEKSPMKLQFDPNQPHVV